MTILAVLGPTAAGKSVVAEALAEAVGGEIVSVDSMQVYRGMDIGTAKPSLAVRARIPHHLIDLVEPSVGFTAAEFQAAGRAALDDIVRRGRTAVVVGGSGLHFRSLVDPLTFPPTDAALRGELEAASPQALRAELTGADPAAARHVDLDNPRRVLRAVEVLRLTGVTPSQRAGGHDARSVRTYVPQRPFSAFGIDPDSLLAHRVEARLDRMIDLGLLAEVASLAPRMGRTAAQAVGYRQLLPVVECRVDLERGRREAMAATLGLAKRQRTFFRRDPRIRWLPWQDDPDGMIRRALEMLEASWTS